MSNVLDRSNDVGLTELYRDTQLYRMPRYVTDFFKTASQLAAPLDTPSHNFADPVRREFPTDTKAATYLSYLRFLDKAAEMPPSRRSLTLGGLDKAAAFFGIGPDIENLRVKHAELNRPSLDSLPDSAFAIVEKRADGSQVREYPLRNAEEVKAAAGWLVINQDRLPYGHRRKLAEAIREKAAEFGVEVAEEETLRKLAGHGVCPADDIVPLIVGRIHATPERAAYRELRHGMAKLAEGLANRTVDISMDPHALEKLAQSIDLYDQETGLVNKYAEGLPRASDVLFSIDITAASQLTKAAVELSTGNIYSRDQFVALPRGVVLELFGHDFCEKVSTGILVDKEKLAKEASGLPPWQARMLEHLLRDCGQEPLLKAASPRLTFSDLAELAKL